MKKNFLTVVALMVAAFFVATEIAQAADVSFSGQIRTRYEVNEQGGNNANDFNNNSKWVARYLPITSALTRGITIIELIRSFQSSLVPPAHLEI